MEKINEAIQKLIAVSPLVQNCYVPLRGNRTPQDLLACITTNNAQSPNMDLSQDLLAYLVKSEAPSSNYAEQGHLKPYKHILIFGDALMSAVYAAYAYYALRKDYGIIADITLLQLDDTGNRTTAFCTEKILNSLGVEKVYRYTDDVYECRANTLLIIPQHRALMVQELILGDDFGIYTIPGEDVILGDMDLSVFYIDESVHILRRRKQHPECVKWWSEAIRSISFGDTNAYAEVVEAEINKLISHHAPRIKTLYR